MDKNREYPGLRRPCTSLFPRPACGGGVRAAGRRGCLWRQFPHAWFAMLMTRGDYSWPLVHPPPPLFLSFCRADARHPFLSFFFFFFFYLPPARREEALASAPSPCGCYRLPLSLHCQRATAKICARIFTAVKSGHLGDGGVRGNEARRSVRSSVPSPSRASKYAHGRCVSRPVSSSAVTRPFFKYRRSLEQQTRNALRHRQGDRWADGEAGGERSG